MRSRIIFFNRQGTPLDEIAASVKRSWMLNDIGNATFTMSKRDPKLIKSTVEFGNYVLILNPYTKPWAGVLDTPRNWTRKGPQLSAYSTEILLSYMQDQDVASNNIIQAAVKLTGAAGSLFTQMIQRMNEKLATLVDIGNIYGGGITRDETLSNDYLTHAKRVADRSGNDFDLTPSLQDNGTLAISANWYLRKGVARDITLEEGVNVQAQDTIATEQGIITNSALGIGSGSTEATRIGAIARNDASISQYGLRRGSVQYASVTQVSTLQANTQAYLAANAYPTVTSKVVCTDTSLWRQMNEGDLVPLKLHNAGFSPTGGLGMDATTRILGLQTDDDKETLEVLINSWQGDD